MRQKRVIKVEKSREDARKSGYSYFKVKYILASSAIHHTAIQ